MKLNRAKALVAAATIALAALSPAASAETVVGIRAGYNTRSGSPSTGIVFQYRLSEHFRIAPNVDYYFRHNNVDAFSFNGNAQFPIRLTPSGRSSFYPFAGINYTSWNHHDSPAESNDVISRTNRVGLNFGAGYEYYASPSLKLSAEAKGTLLKSFSSATFTISIGYVF